MKKHLLMAPLAMAALAQQGTLTTNGGAPVGDNQNSKTAGADGPVLLEDIHLIEKLAAFDRERIPERVVHARGAGAHGVFESAGDFSAHTKAAFLGQAGKRTPVFVRFSTVIHPSGSPETARDPRGFATKFYTEQGNYDIVGNNLPVFFIRDAMKFPDMVHALKPSPVSNRQDPNRVFDFFQHIPEAVHMLTWVYSDRGIPANYREMDGFGVHAFKWVNAAGEVKYVKYTWRSEQGVRSLPAREAARVQGEDASHATHDLYESIRAGKHPAWTLHVQMLEPAKLDQYEFNPLDPTKVWPESVAPLVKVGRMVLDRVPDNFFEASEQSAFSPGNLIPGIEASEDRLLQGRLFSYFDTQRHRVGPNFQQLPVNRTLAKLNSLNQDGAMSARGTASEVNYQPSGTGDGRAFSDSEGFKYSSRALSGATMQRAIAKKNNFAQAGELYRSLSETDKRNLIANLAGDLGAVKNRAVQVKMTGYFFRADAGYGTRLAEALKLPVAEVKSAPSGE